MGVYGTLMQMLKASPSLQGVAVEFGEEYITSQSDALPFVVVVPGAGNFGNPGEPGYAQDLDPNIDATFKLRENVDLWVWAVALDGSGQPQYDATSQADATDDVRSRLIQAFYGQRSGGLYFEPIASRWQTMQNAQNRYGRACVMTVRIELTFTDVPPVYAPVKGVTLDVTNT